MLPAELVTPLGWIGLDWPTADEEQLLALGQGWVALGGQLAGLAGGSNGAAQLVWQENAGSAVTAFQKHWTERGAGRALEGMQVATVVLGIGLIVYAVIVLALKIVFIIQLVILLIQVTQAIALAVATAGASLAEIPIFQQLTRIIVDQLIDQVITEILSA